MGIPAFLSKLEERNKETKKKFLKYLESDMESDSEIEREETGETGETGESEEEDESDDEEEDKSDKDIKRIYIDIQFVHGVIMEKNPELNLTNCNYDILIKLTINEIKTMIKRITEKTNCKILIFFESVPSVAKLQKNIQRKTKKIIRRKVEKELKTRLLIENGTKEEGLDSSETDTTFGVKHTYFNSEYTKYLIEAIENSDFEDVEIHSYNKDDKDNNKGEGEHRILNHIKKNISPENKNEIFYICTSDSDVILISVLLTNMLKHNITVNANIRKKNSNGKWIDINFFSKKFIKYAKTLVTVMNKKSIHDIINDLIFCLNLFGNDFIPGIYKLIEGNNEFENIIKTICRIDGNIINYDEKKLHHTINKTRLYTFIEKFSNENTNIKKEYYNLLVINDYKGDIKEDRKHLCYETICKQLDYGTYIYNSESKTNTKHMDIEKNRCGRMIRINMFNIREYDGKKIVTKLNQSFYSKSKMYEYDNEHLEEDITSETIISRATRYLEGLDFMVSLYFNSNTTIKTNYFWYYEYYKAPTVYELLLLGGTTIPSHNPKNEDIEYFDDIEYLKYIKKSVYFNIKNTVKKYLNIGYDEILSFDYKKRILFGYGVNNYNDMYLKQRYFIVPQDYKKSIIKLSCVEFNFKVYEKE